MAGIPQNFQALSNVLPTYSFVDIASGTGYIEFLAGTTVDLKLLSNVSYYSDTVFSTGGTSAGSLTLVSDEDYDVVLNRPMDIRGTGIVNVPLGLTNPGNNAIMYVNVALAKWDGSTETAIVNNDSRQFSRATNATRGFDMVAVDLDIPLTHFKKGETLRLTIKSYGQGNGSLATVDFGHDPQGRSASWDTSGAVSSTLSFQCPVRLNL